MDEEGRVWSCGRNDSGQLGLGHKNETLTFQRIETIAKLKQHLLVKGEEERPAEIISEKEMFKSIEKEQNKPLMDKIKSCQYLHANKQQAKQKIIEGVIGMADWPSKWKDIHAKNQQLNQSIQELLPTLDCKQQQLD